MRTRASHGMAAQTFHEYGSEKQVPRLRPHRVSVNGTNKGAAKAATQIFHGHVMKVRVVCGPYQHTSQPVSDLTPRIMRKKFLKCV